MKYFLAGLLLFTGCVKSKSHQTDVFPESFELKYKTYADLVTDYPEDDCDWLLFQSLTDTALNKRGVVERAKGSSPGRWYRTPAHDCLTTKRSDSDISRDMLLGLAFYLWQTDDRKNVQEIVDFADGHDGIMGGGDKFRTDIRPILRNTYKSILARTGSVPLPPKTDSPNIDGGIQSLTDIGTGTGFEAHLMVLHVLLRGLVYGQLSSLEMNILSSQADRSPRNALFQAVYHKFLDGDQSEALTILMDTSLFPQNALPTKAQFCAEWIWQRDDGDDWDPCKDDKPHTGGDWLFAAAVVRNGIREATHD